MRRGFWRIAPFAVFAALVAITVYAVALREPAAPRDGGGFDLFAFFEGDSVSAGTVTVAGIFTTPFTATFRGARAGETFVLEERFRFPESTPRQIWRLASRDGALSGTVETQGGDGALHEPVPVEGVSGADGVVLTYTGIAPGGGMALSFRHEMRMQPDGTVRNRVRVSKFGVPLASSAVTFAKERAALPSSDHER